MKSSRRRMFNGLTVISLLLLLVTVTAWALTLHREEGFLFHAGQDYWLWSYHGGLGLDKFSLPSSFNYFDSATTRLAKFGSRRPPLIRLPHWPIALCAAIAPLWWIIQFPRVRRQRLRIASGQCTRCGYDLRATPERCPECGTIQKKVI